MIHGHVLIMMNLLDWTVSFEYVKCYIGSSWSYDFGRCEALFSCYHVLVFVYVCLLESICITESLTDSA
ncbi:hypothetical protein CICLE_v10026905mg [Citrus x clementina]|uniref:Uncharacterized protein n=1 Tax=Citrus clementina TaxID=85681 RepID=V4UKS9_CITCL|nr:hypothetical protein CICLE_v10026905mg [Citrus x clementina]